MLCYVIELFMHIQSVVWSVGAGRVASAAAAANFHHLLGLAATQLAKPSFAMNRAASLPIPHLSFGYHGICPQGLGFVMLLCIPITHITQETPV